MPKHTRYGLTAEQSGSSLFLTTHFPLESPLTVAAEKAAQLLGLLFMASDYAASRDTFAALEPAIQAGILALASALAHETLVLSEMAVLHGPELAGDS